MRCLGGLDLARSACAVASRGRSLEGLDLDRLVWRSRAVTLALLLDVLGLVSLALGLRSLEGDLSRLVELDLALCLERLSELLEEAALTGFRMLLGSRGVVSWYLAGGVGRLLDPTLAGGKSTSLRSSLLANAA